MTPFYTLGRAGALELLGLSKLAAIGAKTMLPTAMKSMEGLLPAALKGGERAGLQTGRSSAVSKQVLSESPWHQYMSIAGPGGGAAESGLSKMFKNQMAGQAPKNLGQAMPANLGTQATLRPQAVAESFAPTMPPPARMPSMAPTVPPPPRA